MDNQKVARELLKVAKSLVGGKTKKEEWGANGWDELSDEQIKVIHKETDKVTSKACDAFIKKYKKKAGM